MQTHCPHCETHFRITESQIDIADGYVRCGVCEEVFNIYEVANDDSPDDKQQLPLSDTDDTPEDIDEHQSETEDLNHEEESNFHHNALPDSDPVTSEDIFDKESDQEMPDDFFDEDINEPLDYIVPTDIRRSASSKPHSAAVTALWSIGILLLISSLAIEYVWFNRDEFHQFPALQAQIEKLCQQLNCKKQSQRDPSKIQLITRNVYSHPNEKDALMINVIMKNNADFAQAYPVMQIDFSDIRGNSVAARRFFPFEYLATRYQDSETKQQHLLQPDTDANITLEIKDPGKDAMTYEFNFL